MGVRGGHKVAALADLSLVYLLCDGERVTQPLWVLVFSSMKWEMLSRWVLEQLVCKSLETSGVKCIRRRPHKTRVKEAGLRRETGEGHGGNKRERRRETWMCTGRKDSVLSEGHPRPPALPPLFFILLLVLLADGPGLMPRGVCGR